MLKLIVPFLIFMVVGCVPNNKKLNWRTDNAPIVKRIPQLSNVTNMMWHGEIITKKSFLSVPGPSAYRIMCIIPQASQIIPTQIKDKLEFLAEFDDTFFQLGERDVLKSNYGIDLDCNAQVTSDEFAKSLIKSPYWGQCLYFTEKDVLCIILFGD